jgi:hypothetical protein
MNVDVKPAGSTRLSISASSAMHTCGGGLETHDNAQVVANDTPFGAIGCRMPSAAIWGPASGKNFYIVSNMSYI